MDNNKDWTFIEPREQEKVEYRKKFDEKIKNESTDIPSWLLDKDQEELRNIDYDNALVEKHNKEGNYTPMTGKFKSALYNRPNVENGEHVLYGSLPKNFSIADIAKLNNSFNIDLEKMGYENAKNELEKYGKVSNSQFGIGDSGRWDLTDQKTKELFEKFIGIWNIARDNTNQYSD
jgi:hypothetical protein